MVYRCLLKMHYMECSDNSRIITSHEKNGFAKISKNLVRYRSEDIISFGLSK